MKITTFPTNPNLAQTTASNLTMVTYITMDGRPKLSTIK
jgi:hypothetical protein